MKRIVTVFFIFFSFIAISAQAQRAALHTPAHRIGEAANSGISAPITASNISTVFLEKSDFIPLASYEVELDSNNFDTSGGNWWISNVVDSFFDTVSNGTLPDTMYTLGLAERFVTSLTKPYVDSLHFVFLDDTIPSSSNISFTLARVSEQQVKNGNTYPFPDYSTGNVLSTVTYPASKLTQGAFNLITVKFGGAGKALLSTTYTDPEYAILVQRGGTTWDMDSGLYYQLDANESNFDPSYTIDPTADFTYEYSQDKFDGWETQSFYFDQQTAADPSQAFFGNMVMVVYLHDPSVPAGVSVDPASEYRLAENYPNPVSTSSSINYNLGQSGPATIVVYNQLGETVATLVNSVQGAGEHTVSFNAGTLPDGMYYYKLQSGDFTATRTLVIAR